jgi:hypothetical protein
MLTFTCEPTSEGIFEMVAGDSQLDSACSGRWRKKVQDRNEDVFGSHRGWRLRSKIPAPWECTLVFISESQQYGVTMAAWL